MKPDKTLLLFLSKELDKISNRMLYISERPIVYVDEQEAAEIEMKCESLLRITKEVFKTQQDES